MFIHVKQQKEPFVLFFFLTCRQLKMKKKKKLNTLAEMGRKGKKKKNRTKHVTH